MAQSLPPGDIITHPSSKLVFNGPFNQKHTYHIKVINNSGRRIGWTFETNIQDHEQKAPQRLHIGSFFGIRRRSSVHISGGQALKTTNKKRHNVEPSCGVLDPNEAVRVAVSCEAFAFGQEDTDKDRVTIVWTNAPNGAAKQFKPAWFERGDGIVRRKNLPIEYNS